MNASIIITSFNEPESIKTAIKALITNDLSDTNIEILVIAPDDATLNSAKEVLKDSGFQYKLLHDMGVGKPAALNLAVSEAKYDNLVLTDGDVFLSKNAIKSILDKLSQPKVGGVSGQPVSTSDNSTRFGYYSNIFCSAADKKRQSGDYVHMSGYIFGIVNLPGLFPIPTQLRAEDAYISLWIKANNYSIDYAREAISYVKFPTNKKDWMKQKLRSLGGNIQLKLFTAHFPQDSRTSSRSISEDLKMLIYPFKFVTNPKQFLYTIMLYPLRLELWLRIYYNHFTNKYSDGMWERIESTK